MTATDMILCRDINGDVHIVRKASLVQRTSVYGVIESNVSFLLVRDRTRSDNKWDLPGGGVHLGENLSTALIREIKEETNLDILDTPRKICEFTEYFYDVESERGWESTRHCYFVTANGTLRTEGNDDDVIEAAYFKYPLSSSIAAPVAREVTRIMTSRY